MTTIRRIVVSQIDGNGADSVDNNELRPFGETSFYIDNNNKLTLLMFNGTRTHRKSKVLAPGVLWGSNADSGDGSGFDTIKLIPDSELFANGSNQYIIVDPTLGEPGHIHLRAGGTQDSSTADLYLGGERTFVRVSDTYDNVAIGTTGTNANFWTFGSDGNLTLPGDVVFAGGGVIQETVVTNELWGTTTTSLTLVPAGAANGTQRLEIYSTGGGEGNHIHITSGDQNQTDLFLGNDTQYFSVGAMGQMEVRARPGLESPSPGTGAYAGSPVWIYAGDAGDNGGNQADGALGGDILLQAGTSTIGPVGLGGSVYLQSGNGVSGYGSIKLSTDNGSTYLEFNKDGKLTLPSGGTLGPEGMGASGLSNGTSGNPVYIVNKKTNGDYLANIILTAGDGISGEISFEIWNTVTAVSKVLTINTACNLVFPDASVQNTAWVGGGSSVVQTNLIFSNDIDTRTFNNTGSVAINFTAYTGGPSFNTEWAYQSPLNDSVGITVLAATVASTATSTSTTTGALTVAGGVGIQGDLWAGNIYSNGVQLTAGGGGSGVTADSTTTFTNKTLNITLGGNDFQIQGNSIYSYSGSGPTLALTQVPTFQGFNFNDSGISGDGGTGVYYWTAGGADGTGTINKAGVLRTAGTSSNALFTFGANGAGTMSVQLDGSLFVGATLPTNSGGLNTDYPGWLVVQSGAKFGGDIDTLGRVLLNGSQFEDDSGVIDFLNVAGGAGNHIITCTSDWTLKVKARANGANQGNLWLEAGQNTKIKVKGNGSNIDIIAGDGTSSATWNFAKTGGLQLPSNGSIDFYTGSQTVPYIPGPVLSVYYNEPNSPYYTAFSGSEGIRIPFNTAVSNEGNQYNLATQIYTCPRSGWYSITVSASAVTNNTYYIQLRSGSGDGNIVQQLYGGPPQGNMNGNVLVYLTLNQLYQIRILCGGGLAGEVYGGQYTTYLMMAHIRD